MLESRRRFKRFDLPLIVKFRPAGGKPPYSLGLLKNISYEGLNLEAREFNFIQHEKLELELRFSQANASVSLVGDVMWKKQDGNINFAGVKFLVKDDLDNKEIIEKIAYHTNIPVDSFLNGKDVYMKNIGKGNFLRPAAHKIDPPQNTQCSGLIKEYHEGGSRCKVTFILPKETAQDAGVVEIAGDFNNWDISGAQMVKLESGDFSLSLELDSKREYKFRYLIDGHRWENDWYADKYVPNIFGSDDSVVIT